MTVGFAEAAGCRYILRCQARTARGTVLWRRASDLQAAIVAQDKITHVGQGFGPC